MKEYQFACHTCREPFQILLPERINLASFSKCAENNSKGHNFAEVSQCTNCKQTNTVYYCIRDHYTHIRN